MTPGLFDGDHLGADMRALKGICPPSDVDLLWAFLDEVAGSADAVWKLPRWTAEHSSPYFNVRAIDCLQDARYNVYRLRPLAGRLQQFRVIYAFHNTADEFHLLAAVRKLHVPPVPPTSHDYDYQPQHPITQRICAEYDSRGFPRLP